MIKIAVWEIQTVFGGYLNGFPSGEWDVSLNDAAYCGLNLTGQLLDERFQLSEYNKSVGSGDVTLDEILNTFLCDVLLRVILFVARANSNDDSQRRRMRFNWIRNQMVWFFAVGRWLFRTRHSTADGVISTIIIHIVLPCSIQIS